MKLISTKTMLAIAVSVGVSFAANAETVDVKNAPVTSAPATTVAPAPIASPLTIQPENSAVVETESTKTVDKKAETKKPEKKYSVTKSTLYNQLVYDFGKQGYKVVWDLKFDPSFTKGEYDSIEDQMVYAINRLNEVWNGSFEDGNKVQGLICPENKAIHFVYSNKAAKVVDKDGMSCNLITPLENNKGQVYSGVGQAINPNVPAGNNYYESGNILSGPMIVGQ